MSHEEKEVSALAIIYTTFPDGATAEGIARQLIEKKMIACVNIMPMGTSIYEWDNGIRTASECVVLFKTTSFHLSRVMEEIKQLHPYEEPALIELKAGTVEGTYFEWVKKQVLV